MGDPGVPSEVKSTVHKGIEGGKREGGGRKKIEKGMGGTRIDACTEKGKERGREAQEER